MDLSRTYSISDHRRRNNTCRSRRLFDCSSLLTEHMSLTHLAYSSSAEPNARGREKRVKSVDGCRCVHMGLEWANLLPVVLSSPFYTAWLFNKVLMASLYITNRLTADSDLLACWPSSLPHYCPLQSPPPRAFQSDSLSYKLISFERTSS